MDDKRLRELLRNAVFCFKHNYSPFCHEELSKMNVTADECKDLSVAIAEIIEDYLDFAAR